MGCFYILTFIIGFWRHHAEGEERDRHLKDAAGALIGQNNMAAVHLADAVGGNLFLSYLSGGAFATILYRGCRAYTCRCICGVAHDLYANVFAKAQPA